MAAILNCPSDTTIEIDNVTMAFKNVIFRGIHFLGTNFITAHLLIVQFF